MNTSGAVENDKGITVLPDVYIIEESWMIFVAFVGAVLHIIYWTSVGVVGAFQFPQASVNPNPRIVIASAQTGVVKSGLSFICTLDTLVLYVIFMVPAVILLP